MGTRRTPPDGMHDARLLGWPRAGGRDLAPSPPIPGPDSDRPLPQLVPTAKALLDERLARGDIEVDDYRKRLDALAAGTDDR